MPKKFGPQRIHQRTLRLTDANSQYLAKEIEAGRFASVNSYFNDLLDKHRTGTDSATSQMQDAIVATLTQFRRDLRRDLRSMQQTGDTSSAFLHALAKMLIVTLPEPDDDLKKLLVAKATKKYEKLLLNASKESIERRQHGITADDDTEN